MALRADGSAYSRARSFKWVAIGYAIALLSALVLGYAFRNLHPLLVVAVAGLAATIVVFEFSMAFDNSSVYDPYWSVAPSAIALYFAALGADGGLELRQWIVLVLVFAWGIRLTVNWAVGWPGLGHEDWRYVDIRQRSGANYWLASFAGIHLFPTVQVYLACLALYPALALTIDPDTFGVLGVLATIVTAAAIVIEGVADVQLHRFVRAKAPGAIMDRGLWKYSRHPNYFGEVSFWWGLWLFALAADPAYWWTLVGPLAITVMFVFVSIPMLDDRSVQRRPGYADHKARTSALIPWFPRRTVAT